MINWRVLLVISWLAVEGARAGEPSPVGGWLERPLLGTNTTLTETLAFAEARIPTMARVESAQAWEQIAARLRREVLERVVFRGRSRPMAPSARQGSMVGYHPRRPGIPDSKIALRSGAGVMDSGAALRANRKGGKMPAVLISMDMKASAKRWITNKPAASTRPSAACSP